MYVDDKKLEQTDYLFPILYDVHGILLRHRTYKHYIFMSSRNNIFLFVRLCVVYGR